GGGAGTDLAYGGVVDGAGAATIGGLTASTNFPLAHAAQSTNHANADGFVARIAQLPRGTPGPHDAVVHVASAATLHGKWETVADSGAASGARLHNPDAGA